MADPITTTVAASTMAKAVTGLSIGASLLGGISGLQGNKRAARNARRQADMTFFQRGEERRQTQREYGRILGENRARMFASNLMPSGSSQAVINDMQSEFLRDINNRYNAALAERQAIRAGGRRSDAAVIGGTALNIGSALLGVS